ncbi:DUF551 domain-containing protein [Atlantibacter subterraneus]|uniref:DUF551 domain-containing protein n=1 Tax=Atlantibacter subterraneus TaxID=255519 RepID=UPI0021AE1596|nr:DUF551 domain-containing protein [Atlantibacter subterranea]
MTINERVSDERIANLIEVLSFYSPEDKHLANNESELASALRELQQYRAAEPVDAFYRDALHAAIALTSAGCRLDDYDACVTRLHEWGALPDYCIAIYMDFIHGLISENRLLDFGWINDNGAFSAAQSEKRIAELELALAAPQVTSVPDCFNNAVSALESLYRNGQKQNWNERYTSDMAYASGVLNACRAAMLESSTRQAPVKQIASLAVQQVASVPTVDGVEAAARWVDAQREAYDDEHGRYDPDTGTFEFGNDAQLEYSTTLAEIAEGIRALRPTAAPAVQAEQQEPVSQPYMLRDAVAAIRNSGIGIDAGKIQAERDALNSPVIPDSWIPVSERMPEQGRYISAVSRHGEYVSGLVEGDWLDLHDGTSFGLGEVYLWLPLPELPAAPQQEAK